MATHDKGLQRAHPPLEAEATSTPDDGSSAVAASLLADLAKAPLPTENVRETEGHVAAAYAVAPHKPPRANDKTIETAAVVVNATEPLPIAAAAPAGVASATDGEPTVPGGGPQLTTTPSERSQNKRRVVYASFGGAVVAAVLALVAVVTMTSSGPAPAPSPASPPNAPATTATVLAPAAATAPETIAEPTPTPTPTPTIATTTTPSASAASSSRPPWSPRPKPTGSARPRPAAHPPGKSGNFAEPDRSF